LAWIDLVTIGVYFALVLGAGFWFRRAASESLDAYFLGGRRLHWVALAMSGSVSNFDITGTMWIVSIIYLLGMKSMWHHWMWGVLLGAFFLAYMGKWVRRSNVMTAAEWMKTRFGDGPAGKAARLTYAFMAVLTLASFIGYAYQGIGKFASVYVPLEKLAEMTTSPALQNLFVAHEADVLATAIIALTTLYVIVGGLYSVVVTDVIQTVVLTVGALFIAFLAWSKISPEQLAALPEGFTSLRVPWRLPEFAGTEHAQFEFFGALVIVWVAKGLLLNAGGPGQMFDFQRFLAARDARDACKIGAAWSLFLIVRWGMAMGIALIALTGVAGVTDAERVMPLVLRDFLPVGVRGLVIAGLLAAFMSTFSSTVNSGASFLVRDIWGVLINRNPTHRQAMRASYIATLAIVLGGLAIGFQGESIHQIWGWMMMALGAGVIVPNVLRWYWWRLNGWGYATGTLAGMALSVLQLLDPDLKVWVVFPIIVGTSLVVSIVVSWLTAPVSSAVLTEFFCTVRPFGLWQPVRKDCGLSESQLRSASESPILTIVNVAVAMVVITCAYLAPMYLVGHWHTHALACLALATAGIVALKYTWYNHLPPAE
jgi:solute:Na+ symporter, SSS family